MKLRGATFHLLALAALIPPVAGSASSALTALDEITVTATRIQDHVFSVPYAAHVVRTDDFLDRRSVRTLADALGELPGVMIQRTSYGQASPFIRGFTGFRTLMLVDGIRLNNAVFREGPNQYWSTIDALAVSHLDLVMGPASVLYGSDAIGGTVNTFTHAPSSLNVRSTSRAFGGSGYYRYSSAENSHVMRGRISTNPTSRFGLAAGTTYRTFDDLRAGGQTGVQPGTGYNETSADLKASYSPNAAFDIVASYQRTRQNDVPRTHATVFGGSYAGTVLGTDLRRDLDQSRDLTYVQFTAHDPAPWISRAHLSLSWHRQGEKQDRIRSNHRREISGFTDDQFGVLLNLTSVKGSGRFSYGLEYYLDVVQSFATDTLPEAATRVLPRGPVADDAQYRLLGLYLQEQIQLGFRFAVIAGARYTHSAAHAANVDPDLGDAVRYERLDKTSGALTASLRGQFEVNRNWNLFGGVSQGFRAPNLSDYTSFELARSGERETPAPNLSPEKYLSFETGAKARFQPARGDLYVVFFHTVIEDQITRFPTGRVINGEREVTKANTGDGFAQGIELGASFAIGRGHSLFGSATWSKGEVDTYVGDALQAHPASRVQPLTGRFGSRWQSTDGLLWFEASALFVQRQDRLSPGDVADNQRIPPGGTPGYSVYAIRGAWKVQPRLRLTAALENLTNRDYRIHGSGINEAGRNAVMSATVDF